MRHTKERLILGSILVAGPLLFWFGIMKPSLARIEAQRERRIKAESEFMTPFSFAPLSKDEKAYLDNPDAAWRKRIAVVSGDQSRLVHYATVVGDIQQRWRTAGVPAMAMRSSWDPIHASFTLPSRLGTEQTVPGKTADSPDLKVEGWILEARFDLSTDGLLRALYQAPNVTPLLEPVGLRWEFDPIKGRSQYLIFRNLYLKP
jgi:hypothetical protein